MNKYMAILFIATIFSASSQVLLKVSAKEEHKSWIHEYLNWKVILAYGIFFGVLLANTYAYTKVELKYGPVIDTFTLLREKCTKGQLIGNLIIIAGVLIYTL